MKHSWQITIERNQNIYSSIDSWDVYARGTGFHISLNEGWRQFFHHSSSANFQQIYQYQQFPSRNTYFWENELCKFKTMINKHFIGFKFLFNFSSIHRWFQNRIFSKTVIWLNCALRLKKSGKSQKIKHWIKIFHHDTRNFWNWNAFSAPSFI